MVDDVPSLRPSLLPPLRSLIIGAGLLTGLAGAVVGALVIRDRCDQRRTEARQQVTAGDRAFTEQIVAHFEALRRADVTAAGSTSCPPGVTGKIPVIEKPVLDWLVDDGSKGKQPRPALPVRSPVFHYLDGSLEPGRDDAGALEARRAALAALRTARYLAVVSGDVTDATEERDAMMFEGGEVDATVAIGEITGGQFVCAFRFTSQPARVAWLRPASKYADRAAARHAIRTAMAQAFQSEAGEQLAMVAPGATLDTK